MTASAADHPNWQLLQHHEACCRYHHVTPGRRPYPPVFALWDQVYGPAARRIADDLIKLGHHDVIDPDDIPLDPHPQQRRHASPETDPLVLEKRLCRYLLKGTHGTDSIDFAGAVSSQVEKLVGFMPKMVSSKGQTITQSLRSFRSAQSNRESGNVEQARRAALAMIFDWAGRVLLPGHEGSIEYYRHDHIGNLRRRWYPGSNEACDAVAIVDDPSDKVPLARWIAHRIHDAGHAHHFLHLGCEPEWSTPADLMRLEGTAMAVEHTVRCALEKCDQSAPLPALLIRDLAVISQGMPGAPMAARNRLMKNLVTELNESLLSRLLRFWFDVDSAKGVTYDAWLDKARTVRLDSEYIKTQISATGGIPGYGASYLVGAAACALKPSRLLAPLSGETLADALGQRDTSPGSAGLAQHRRVLTPRTNKHVARRRLTRCAPSKCYGDECTNVSRATSLLSPDTFWLRSERNSDNERLQDAPGGVISDGIHWEAIQAGLALPVTLLMPPLTTPLPRSEGVSCRDLDHLSREDHRILSVVAQHLRQDSCRRFVIAGERNFLQSSADTLLRHLDTRCLYSAVYANLLHHHCLESVLYEFRRQMEFLAKPKEAIAGFGAFGIDAFLSSVQDFAPITGQRICFMIEGLSDVDASSTWRCPAGILNDLERLIDLVHRPRMARSAVVLLSESCGLVDDDHWTVIRPQRCAHERGGEQTPASPEWATKLLFAASGDVSASQSLSAGIQASLDPIRSMPITASSRRLREAFAAFRISECLPVNASLLDDQVILDRFMTGLLESRNEDHQRSAEVLAVASTRVDGIQMKHIRTYDRAAGLVAGDVDTRSPVSGVPSHRPPSIAALLLDPVLVAKGDDTYEEFFTISSALAAAVSRHLESDRLINPTLSSFTLHIAAAAQALLDAEVPTLAAAASKKLPQRARMRLMTAIRHLGLALSSRAPRTFGVVANIPEGLFRTLLTVADGDSWPSWIQSDDQLATDLLALSHALLMAIDDDFRLTAVCGLSKAVLDILSPFFRGPAQPFGDLFTIARIGESDDVRRFCDDFLVRFCNAARDVGDLDQLAAAEEWANTHYPNVVATPSSSPLTPLFTALARAASLYRQSGDYKNAETRLLKIVGSDAAPPARIKTAKRELMWMRCVGVQHPDVGIRLQEVIDDIDEIARYAVCDRPNLAGLFLSLGALAVLLGRIASCPYARNRYDMLSRLSPANVKVLQRLFEWLGSKGQVREDVEAYQLGCRSKILRVLRALDFYGRAPLSTAACKWQVHGGVIVRELAEFTLKRDFGVQMRRRLNRELALACLLKLHHNLESGSSRSTPPLVLHWLALYCEHRPRASGAIGGMEHAMLRSQARVLIGAAQRMVHWGSNRSLPPFKVAASNNHDPFATGTTQFPPLLEDHGNRLIEWLASLEKKTPSDEVWRSHPPPCGLGVF